MIDTPEPQPPPGRRSRLEDEVLEILTRSDRPPTFADRSRSTLQRWKLQVGQRSSAGGSILFTSFDTGLWLVGCLILGIAAFALSEVSPLAGRILGLSCFGLILFAIVRSFGRASRRNAKQWRGREIDISPGGRPLWIDRVFRNQRRPPRPPRR